MSPQSGPRLVETLVSWMAPQVMVFLGKVMNPITQKTERDLPSARVLIDLLAELEEKTEGRLDDHERKLLQRTLTELRLNYLDEVAKPEPQASQSKESQPSSPADLSADEVGAGETREAAGTRPENLEPGSAADTEIHPDDVDSEADLGSRPVPKPAGQE